VADYPADFYRHTWERSKLLPPWADLPMGLKPSAAQLTDAAIQEYLHPTVDPTPGAGREVRHVSGHGIYLNQPTHDRVYEGIDFIADPHTPADWNGVRIEAECSNLTFRECRFIRKYGPCVQAERPGTAARGRLLAVLAAVPSGSRREIVRVHAEAVAEVERLILRNPGSAIPLVRPHGAGRCKRPRAPARAPDLLDSDPESSCRTNEDGQLDFEELHAEP